MPVRYSSTAENTDNLLIGRILDDSYNHQDVVLFINLCTSIAAAYLKTELFYKRIYFPIVQDSNNELKDISLDLIAPLFERDQSDSFKIFKSQLLAKHNQCESLFNRLKSIIISKTRQELIQRFKEEEPGGYKILRNIKLAPDRNSKIKTFNDQSKTYFYYFEGECQEPFIDHLQAELPEIEIENLVDITRVALLQDTVIPKILEYILIYIKKDNTCRDFVEISSLFKALKKVLLYQTVPIDNVFQHNGYSNNHNGEEYNSIIYRELEDYIVLTVKDKYQNKGKITENEALYYKSVIKEYFNDIVFAHNNNALPHYLNNGHSNFVTEDNSTIHRTRIEYIIKICKKRLYQIISKY